MNNKVVFSPKEETSILLEGDFDRNSYSKILRIAFFQSLAINTKIPDWIKFMSGMSGKKYRYFINNLISLIDDPRYLEIGCWAGSTACSALYGNEVKALCIDNWSEFVDPKTINPSLNVKNPKKEFEINTKKVISEKINFKFIESDFRKINYNEVGKFNIYVFDGPHEMKDHYDGITIVQPSLDDVFILIVDDWNISKVRQGTLNAISDLSIKIISKIEIMTTQNNVVPKLLQCQFSDWHNGYLIAVCEKTIKN